MLIKLILLGIMLLLSAFFSGSETALFSLDQIQIQKMLKEKRPNAHLISKLLKQPTCLLITILVGNMFVNIASSTLATAIATNLLGNKGIGIAIGIMTFLILIFGEITPKTYAVHNAERLSQLVIVPLNLFSYIILPLRKILESLTNIMINSPLGYVKETQAATEDELRTIIELGHKEGIVKEFEKEMIHNVFDINQTNVSKAMTYRLEIFSIDINTTCENAIKQIRKKGFSRVPVYENEPENIIGIVYTKDFLLRKLHKKSTTLRDMLHTVYYVPDSKKLGKM